MANEPPFGTGTFIGVLYPIRNAAKPGSVRDLVAYRFGDIPEFGVIEEIRRKAVGNSVLEFSPRGYDHGAVVRVWCVRLGVERRSNKFMRLHDEAGVRA